MTLSEKQLIWFPCALGITGQVFKNNSELLATTFKPNNYPDYLNDIDNILGIKQI
jgi:hypothetical protein